MYSPQYRRCVVHVTGNNRPTCLTIWQPTTPEICGPVPTGFDRSRKHSSRSRERLPPYCFVASSRSRRRRASAGAPCPTIRTGASAPAGPGSRCCSRSPSRSLRRRRRRRPSRRPCSPSTSTDSTTPSPSTPSCCLGVFWGRPAALGPPWCYSSPCPSLSSSAVQGRQYFGAGWRVRSRRCRKTRALWRRPRAPAPRRWHCKRPETIVFCSVSVKKVYKRLDEALLRLREGQAAIAAFFSV
jgi:hypothetical protein